MNPLKSPGQGRGFRQPRQGPKKGLPEGWRKETLPLDFLIGLFPDERDLNLPTIGHVALW
ncbi:hypothetical protein ED312_10185 [Sinomicrobium pectinilyticum]|uniref:Uncharacterized protein n=1 Tax=Sinomicrobium pectinilyticum TaxID=1084421 RepID=A0A3N0EH17_SINP1|nr:hypothetical protein ED312_10185 [Sinomicrobium pectinilyticum]